mmetsp:Transcript_6133/g.10214  ORF Transcript_6133/g.10214 Transcript_6133/m.10214 type:complete len:348 (-) Transcript_6133:1721-2764(-)
MMRSCLFCCTVAAAATLLAYKSMSCRHCRAFSSFPRRVASFKRRCSRLIAAFGPFASKRGNASLTSFMCGNSVATSSEGMVKDIFSSSKYSLRTSIEALCRKAKAIAVKALLVEISTVRLSLLLTAVDVGGFPAPPLSAVLPVVLIITPSIRLLVAVDPLILIGILSTGSTNGLAFDCVGGCTSARLSVLLLPLSLLVVLLLLPVPAPPSSPLPPTTGGGVGVDVTGTAVSTLTGLVLPVVVAFPVPVGENARGCRVPTNTASKFFLSLPPISSTRTRRNRVLYCFRSRPNSCASASLFRYVSTSIPCSNCSKVTASEVSAISVSRPSDIGSSGVTSTVMYRSETVP